MDALLERYPTPWTLFYDDKIDPDELDGGFRVESANGHAIIDCHGYSWTENTTVSLSWKEAQELVNFINEQSGRG